MARALSGKVGRIALLGDGTCVRTDEVVGGVLLHDRLLALWSSLCFILCLQVVIL